jgi:hypothetical protein
VVTVRDARNGERTISIVGVDDRHRSWVCELGFADCACAARVWKATWCRHPRAVSRTRDRRRALCHGDGRCRRRAGGWLTPHGGHRGSDDRVPPPNAMPAALDSSSPRSSASKPHHSSGLCVPPTRRCAAICGGERTQPTLAAVAEARERLDARFRACPRPRLAPRHEHVRKRVSERSPRRFGWAGFRGRV